MRERNGATAIVIGAGIAGLVTARVLSEHVDRVTVLERDRLPQDAVTRRSIPQGRHAHVLLATGQQLLAGWFPGLVDELVRAGAVPLDAKDLVWHQAGAHRVRSDLGFLTMSMSRPLLECTVRERLLRQRSNVSITDETAVDHLILEGGRVAGVRTDGTEHRADLVVDCTGRNTRFLDQLATAGFPAPEVSAIRIDTAYGTRTVRRRPDDLDGTLALVVDDPARGHRMGMMVPVEGGRWIVTVGSLHGDVPPTEPAEYEDFARSLPSPEIADVLARAEALTPVLSHRMPTSRRRHVERLERTSPGFLVLGDAICSLNPLHWQGMSAAALQARALGQAVERHGPASPTLARDFYRRAARVVDVPWRIAAGADFADPRTSGSKPPGTGLVNRYLDKVFLACHTSVPVARQTLRVQNLLARPQSLMTPAMVIRVLLAARRSPARVETPAGPAVRRRPVA
ncbi:FAD-dependent oxidoreductase [Streptomyces phaeochromogenes]|uniref:FAD-dependent oxidoreductase n=1 Tax=Streptomyces phaeochromogenes TaxID=1923 RepID=UPI0038654240|nr:FAD-dependent oxidoreductase [Streptomyces phaeochromogenes]